MKIFLDDVRDPPDNSWTVARTYDMAREMIIHNFVEEISFDHDLGEVESLYLRPGTGYHPSGYDLLCWIEELVLTKGLPAPRMNVHSANPVGVRKMNLAIKSLQEYAKMKEDLNDSAT